MVVPFNFAFGLHDNVPFFVDVCLEIILIIDIFITINCGFYTKGMLIMQRRQIVVRYFKTWLILDILSAIPVYSIFSSSFGENIHEPVDELYQKSLNKFKS